jgi:anti-sigma factor RsiW
MSSNFKSHHDHEGAAGNFGSHNGLGGNQPTGALNTMKRDRFELLSAYLDGEVSPAERRQVESWLATDPVVQKLYDRLLRLRQGMTTLPIPPSPQPVEETVQAVLARVDRRPRNLLFLGGTAIAALFIGAVSSVMPGDGPLLPQLARSNQPAQTAEPLMIALDHPVIEIPKAAVSTPDQQPKTRDSRDWQSPVE